MWGAVCHLDLYGKLPSTLTALRAGWLEHFGGPGLRVSGHMSVLTALIDRISKVALLMTPSRPTAAPESEGSARRSSSARVLEFKLLRLVIRYLESQGPTIGRYFR